MKKLAAFAAVTILFALEVSAEVPSGSSIEGTVRSVDPDLLRIAVETTSGDLIAAFGTFDTPVVWEGRTYRITNLEVGDGIRMELSGSAEDRKIDSITVLESVSESKPDEVPRSTTSVPTPAPVEVFTTPERSEGTTVTSYIGRIDHKRPDRDLFRIITDGGLNWIRVDASNARTPDGAPIRVADLVFGETVEVVGHMGENGELIATVVRREAHDYIPRREPDEYDYDDEPVVEPDSSVSEPAYEPRQNGWLNVVEFEGEVVSEIQGQTIRIRNDITRQVETLWCDPELVVLLDDDPMPASDLEEGMRVEVRALRTSEGLIVQSIIAEEQ